MALPISTRFANERSITFLNESNRIEGIDQIDYHNPVYQDLLKGHFGAYVASQQLAIDRKPLDVKTIAAWQGMITREQIQHGHSIENEEIGHIRGPSVQKNVRIGTHIPPVWQHVPSLLTYLVEDINDALKKTKSMDDVNFCTQLGSFFQRFEAIHPFADGNGRTGRLLANYLATYMRRPIIVFQSDMIDRNKYYKAHESQNAMCLFMATKVKEAVFSIQGNLLFKVKDLSGSSIEYSNTDKTDGEVIEWHELDAKMRSEWVGEVNSSISK